MYMLTLMVKNNQCRNSCHHQTFSVEMEIINKNIENKIMPLMMDAVVGVITPTALLLLRYYLQRVFIAVVVAAIKCRPIVWILLVHYSYFPY